MIKRVSLVARKPGMTLQDFERHWTGPHVEIVRQMPGLRGMRLNLVQDVDGDREWDGVGELWFDSIDAARAAFQSEPVRTLLMGDRPRFIGKMQAYYVTEETVIPPAADTGSSS